MRFRSILAGTALVTLLGAGAAIAQNACLTNDEAVAIKARMLQTELMVATLSCRRAVSHETAYNGFIDRHSAELQRHNRVIQQHFGRTGGGNPQRRYDTFTTALANDASSRSLGAADFCETSYKLFDAVAAVERGRLGAYVAALGREGSLRTGEQCGRDPAMQYALAR